LGGIVQKKGENTSPKSGSVRQGLRSQLSAFLKEILFVLGTVLLINSFVLASFEVPSSSMEDTVMVGDRLFVNKFIYGGSTPYTLPFTSLRIPHIRVPGFRAVARGDVIVFDWPGNRDQVEKPEQTWYVKRCIALPGDTLQIIDRVVYENGQVFPNPPHLKFLRNWTEPAGYPNPDIFPKGSGFNEDDYGPIVVPRKGDNLSISPENVGAWEVFIRREGHMAGVRRGRVWIDGHEATKYTVARDYIFAMGDNRDNSLDSRFWGFVPLEDVIGTPMVVFWSWNPQIPLYDLIDKIRSINPARIGTIIR
jgi:signal peptidase I